jgi:hypothetical protein
MGDRIKKLEDRIQEDRIQEASTSTPASSSRTKASSGSETRVVPVAALRESQKYQVALFKRCGAYTTQAALAIEELGRLAFVRHLEQEHCPKLFCKCLEEATDSVKALGLETEVKVKLPEVVQAIDHSKYYDQFGRSPSC